MKPIILSVFFKYFYQTLKLAHCYLDSVTTSNLVAILKKENYDLLHKIITITDIMQGPYRLQIDVIAANGPISLKNCLNPF